MAEGAIFTQCVYDVDNRYVDLIVSPVSDGKAFTLKLTDTSNDWVSNVEIELFLTSADLWMVIDRLTTILHAIKERTHD